MRQGQTDSVLATPETAVGVSALAALTRGIYCSLRGLLVLLGEFPLIAAVREARSRVGETVGRPGPRTVVLGALLVTVSAGIGTGSLVAPSDDRGQQSNSALDSTPTPHLSPGPTATATATPTPTPRSTQRPPQPSTASPTDSRTVTEAGTSPATAPPRSNTPPPTPTSALPSRENSAGADELGGATVNADDLSLMHEFGIGTDTLASDTDQDGLSDGFEVGHLLNPRDSDTDGDGIPDGRELDLGTSPLEADSDGDYLPDGAEVHATETLPDASPSRRDVYVELDYNPNCTIPREQIALVQAQFADAPIDNPDGSTGIDLHVRIDEEVTGFNTSANAQYNTKGHYYGVASPSVVNNQMRGWAAPIGFHMKCADPPDAFGRILMHELGHMLGLGSKEYEGIDSGDVPYREYPSVMNYNANDGVPRFSSGEGFDDWEAIEHEQAKPNTSDLNGSSAQV